MTFDEAVVLAQLAHRETMGVSGVDEMEFGWVFGFQSHKFLETGDMADMFFGHGVTIVERDTGDVYCAGATTRAWNAILGFFKERADPLGVVVRYGLWLYKGSLYSIQIRESPAARTSTKGHGVPCYHVQRLPLRSGKTGGQSGPFASLAEAEASLSQPSGRPVRWQGRPMLRAIATIDSVIRER